MRVVLYAPLVAWLLWPSGLCMCHLPERVAACLRGEALPPEAPDDHEDHAPGCPIRKMLYVKGECAANAVAADLPTVALLSAGDVPAQVSPAVADPRCERLAHHSASPLYLTLRALRI